MKETKDGLFAALLEWTQDMFRLGLCLSAPLRPVDKNRRSYCIACQDDDD